MSLGGSKEGNGDVWTPSKDKLYQLHSPLLLTPLHLFSHFSAQELKVDTLESSAWILVQAPVLTRNRELD